ncbi:unnamed protein product [Nesidiocoris tenuis]|uniref:Uncharacterized protein n=1 Tax=Nesidiocoris tenuis TaxID=355587 RepID=A0A6H5G7X3_9HEMI|nr:unnamed protein product [Nesidiocoris tenuis]
MADPAVRRRASVSRLGELHCQCLDFGRKCAQAVNADNAARLRATVNPPSFPLPGRPFPGIRCAHGTTFSLIAIERPRPT